MLFDISVLVLYKFTDITNYCIFNPCNSLRVKVINLLIA